MLKGKVIVIDPGHGGTQPGAIGSTGLKEKDVALRIALRVERFLTQLGAICYLTRDKDKTMGLTARKVFSKSKKADAFISIHCNSAADKTARGLETWYYHKGSEPLAKCVQDEMARVLKLVDRGTKQKGFTVLIQPIPAVLAEVGFISNPAEEKLLASDPHQLKTAQAITRGIAKYFA